MTNETVTGKRERGRTGVVRAFGELFRRVPLVLRLAPWHFALIALAALIQAAPPVIIGRVVDILNTGGFDGGVRQWLALAAVGIALVLFTVYYLQLYVGHVIHEVSCTTFQFELYRHIQRLSADFFQRNRTGEITSRLTGDISDGVGPLYGSIANVAGAVVFLVAAGTALLYASTALFLVLMVLIAVTVVYGNIVVPRVRKRYRALRDFSGELNAEIVEKVSAHALIRACAREDAVAAEIEEKIIELRDRTFRTDRFMYAFVTLSMSLNFVFAPFMVLLAGALFLKTGITIGQLVTAYAYWGAMLTRIGALVHTATTVFNATASVDRVTEFFDQTPLVADKPGASDMSLIRGEVELQDVSFSYPVRRDGFSISNVSLHLVPGTVTALVGRSGSGKTTLAQLLARVYDVNCGRITIDGQDVRDVTQCSLRARIGVVAQETLLLDGTIRSNLAFAQPAATQEDMLLALENAGLREFVESLPDGLETVIGEKGVRLSGGQRQRLSIARVFLVDAPLVILDEPTASLDALTEQAVMFTLQALMAGRTGLVIAHRVRTVMDADKIVIVENGRIVDTGKHHDLYERCGFYRTICIEQKIGTMS